jgi:hypothetical protein
MIPFAYPIKFVFSDSFFRRKTMMYSRVYTDSSGETHFEDHEATFDLVNYAPPAPPLYVSATQPVSRFGFIRLEPGWYGDWHPVPSRQFQIILEGELEGEVSDGEVRQFKPGKVYQLEDTTGKGHKSRVVGVKGVVIAVVQLPETR